MNASIAKTLLIAAGLISASAAIAQSTTSVYLIDGRGEVARSGTGLCWRTGYWTPAAAAQDPKTGCACDKDLLPKEVCEPKAPAAPAAAPAPAAPAAKPAEPAPKPAAQKVTLAADALFDFDKAVLRSEGKAKLDDVSAKIKDLKLEVIIAVGHTDRIGTDAYNQKLSQRRAEAVKSYLVGKGIDANRIYTEGKGEKQPVTGDKCKKMGAENRGNKKLIECLQPDRRVEIEVIGTR
jgi:OOP family OmpA-OmpF porin